MMTKNVPNARPSVRDYVSDRVFEGKRKLSPETAERIERAVKDTLKRYPRIMAALAK